MRSGELRSLLTNLNPRTPAGADLVLDLRELLLSQGHPGKCVRCFFGLLGDLRQPAALVPLRNWLESHLEVEVMASGQEIDRLPVMLGRAENLENFCLKALDTIRMDRNFGHPEITLRLRYKKAEPAVIS